MSKDTNSLAHTKWDCKYYIVLAPKYRRQAREETFSVVFFLTCHRA